MSLSGSSYGSLIPVPQICGIPGAEEGLCGSGGPQAEMPQGMLCPPCSRPLEAKSLLWILRCSEDVCHPSHVTLVLSEILQLQCYRWETEAWEKHTLCSERSAGISLPVAAIDTGCTGSRLRSFAYSYAGVDVRSSNLKAFGLTTGTSLNLGEKGQNLVSRV